MIHEYFPEEYLELQKELATGYHPKLGAILMTCAADDIDLKLAHIAYYCGVVLDGAYTLEDRVKLCEILRKRLLVKREKREGESGLVVLS